MSKMKQQGLWQQKNTTEYLQYNSKIQLSIKKYNFVFSIFNMYNVLYSYVANTHYDSSYLK